MKKEIMFGIAGTAILSLLAASLYFRKEEKREIIYDSTITGRKIFYRTGRVIGGMKMPDIMEIHSANGNIEQRIEDYNRNGIIGDDRLDRYEKHTENGKEVYNKDFMITNKGITIYYDPLLNWKYDDGLPRETFDDNISIEAEKNGMSELKNATEIYRACLSIIQHPR